MSSPVGFHNADCRLIGAGLGLRNQQFVESAAGNGYATPSSGSDKSIVNSCMPATTQTLPSYCIANITHN